MRRFKFVVIMPTNGVDLSSIERALDSDFPWSEVDNEENLSQMGLSLPKFKIKHEIDLKPVLQRVGIQTLFERGRADLSGKISYV